MHVIANSFGESSGMLDWIVRNELGNKDAISIFQNTGWEHPATIQFGADQQKHFGTEIIFLEYELPCYFEEKVLRHAPTYENLSKYGFEGMLQTDALDSIRWDRSEVKYKVSSTLKPLFEDSSLREFQADYRRCMKDFYGLFQSASELHRFNVVTADTCNMTGIPMLKVVLYYNALRYVKRLKWTVPNVVHRYCTGRLKVGAMHEFLKRKFGFDKYVKYLGIRRDEPKRYFGNLSSETSNVQVSMPLYDLGINKMAVADFWDQQPFRLLIRDKKYLGNCVNCHLKTLEKKVKAKHEYPLPFHQQTIIEKAANDTMRRVKGHSAEEILFESTRQMMSTTSEDDDQEFFCLC